MEINCRPERSLPASSHPVPIIVTFNRLSIEVRFTIGHENLCTVSIGFVGHGISFLIDIVPG
jgi:hypothetical protein